ncbi:MAG: hypothetical protein AAFW75_20880, partial [Cyanobacteria bacterium J06636_16]
DILMNLKMANQHVSEFRLHLRQFDEVAKVEHDLYDVVRTMQTLAEQAGRTLTKEEDALRIAIKQQTQRMYGDALRQALGESTK